MRLGDRTRDEEPEPGAGLRTAGHGRTTELLEDQLLVVERNPGSLIPNLHAHEPVLRPRADADVSARGRILDGVVDEVLHDLTQSLAVAAEVR